MSLRNIEVQYVGDTLYLPPLEREVNHIVVRDEDAKDWEHFEPKRTCHDMDEDNWLFTCSLCGYEQLDHEHWNYCANCGAKVVSE